MISSLAISHKSSSISYECWLTMISRHLTHFSKKILLLLFCFSFSLLKSLSKYHFFFKWLFINKRNLLLLIFIVIIRTFIFFFGFNLFHFIMLVLHHQKRTIFSIWVVSSLLLRPHPFKHLLIVFFLWINFF